MPLALLGACLLAPAAAATEVSSTELGRLAERAQDDPEALRRLRAVDSVDGRPAGVRLALRGVSGDALEARLRSLADRRAARRPAPAAPAAAAAAREILAERRFRPVAVPRPFREPLQRIGSAVDRVLDWLDRVLPGGRGVIWGALALLVVVLASVVAARVARQRERGGGGRGAGAAAVPGALADTAVALERRAEEAERGGALGDAVRLRFRAGLLRLDEAGVLRLRPSLTSSEAGRRLRSPAFDALARDFDEIAYGGRPPAEPDVAAAREGWPRVLSEAPRR